MANLFGCRSKSIVCIIIDGQFTEFMAFDTAAEREAFCMGHWLAIIGTDEDRRAYRWPEAVSEIRAIFPDAYRVAVKERTG